MRIQTEEPLKAAAVPAQPQGPSAPDAEGGNQTRLLGAGVRALLSRGAALADETGGLVPNYEDLLLITDTQQHVVKACLAKALANCEDVVGTRQAGRDLAQLDSPEDVVVSTSGVDWAILVADTGNNRVLQCSFWDPLGPCKEVVRVKSPRSIFIHQDGSYVILHWDGFNGGRTRVLRCLSTRPHVVRANSEDCWTEVDDSSIEAHSCLLNDVVAISESPFQYLVTDCTAMYRCPGQRGKCEKIIDPKDSFSLKAPKGVAIDGHGKYVVADSEANSVLRCSPSGSTRVWGRLLDGCTPVAGNMFIGHGAALSGPTDIAVDPHGDFFVADRNYCRVDKCPNQVTGEKKECEVVHTEGCAKGLHYIANVPSRIAEGIHGFVLVADTEDHKIKACVVSFKDVCMDVVGGNRGRAMTELDTPLDVTMSPDENDWAIYVADTGNRRVLKCSGWRPGVDCDVVVRHVEVRRITVRADGSYVMLEGHEKGDRIIRCSRALGRAVDVEDTSSGHCWTEVDRGSFDGALAEGCGLNDLAVVEDSHTPYIVTDCTGIWRCPSRGHCERVVGPESSGVIKAPQGIDIDRRGKYIVTETSAPSALVCDPKGSRKIWGFTLDGCRRVAGTGRKGGSDMTLNNPTAISVESDGESYFIADRGNCRVQRCPTSANLACQNVLTKGCAQGVWFIPSVPTTETETALAASAALAKTAEARE